MDQDWKSRWGFEGICQSHSLLAFRDVRRVEEQERGHGRRDGEPHEQARPVFLRDHIEGGDDPSVDEGDVVDHHVASG